MNRQEYNLKIAELFENSNNKLIKGIAPEFKGLVEEYPYQRAGQIITNYIIPDYRNSSIDSFTRDILELLFPGNPDPFFEESEKTFKRLSENGI